MCLLLLHLRATNPFRPFSTSTFFSRLRVEHLRELFASDLLAAKCCCISSKGGRVCELRSSS